MTLTYFCYLDTHFNYGLRLPLAYTAVVRLATTAAFLVTDESARFRFFWVAKIFAKSIGKYDDRPDIEKQCQNTQFFDSRVFSEM